MKIKLKEPFELRLNVQDVELKLVDVFEQNGTPMCEVILDIKASQRFATQDVEQENEDGQLVTVSQSVLVPLTSPYNLERPTTPPIAFELYQALVAAAANPAFLSQINAAIEAQGFNNMFQGSLEGLKLEIDSVTL
jgi:uncharacterized protein YkuJ